MPCHRRYLRTVVAYSALVLLALSDPLFAQEFTDAIEVEQRGRRPKTLFEWAVGQDEAEEEDEDDRLVTDRPHFSEASSLVGLGTAQLEVGYSYFRDADAGTVVTTHSFPEPLLRWGIFAEWFEFRLGYNYLVESTFDPIAGPSRLSGSDDMYVACKLALAEQKGCLPEVALFPQMRVPTGSKAFTSEEVLPGFNLAYSWKLNDLVELECNTQLNRRRDDIERFYTEFIQTVNVEYDITEWFGGFTEWFCFVPSGATAAHTEHYFQGGFVFFPTNNIQLDLHAGVGLNPAATDLAFTGAGASFRF